MTRGLCGEERLSIFQSKMGPSSAADFSAGPDGFMARLNFKNCPQGQYELAAFNMYRPKDQFIFRVDREDGKILIVFTLDANGKTTTLYHSTKKPESLGLVSPMVDEKLFSFIAASKFNRYHGSSGRGDDSSPQR